MGSRHFVAKRLGGAIVPPPGTRPRRPNERSYVRQKTGDDVGLPMLPAVSGDECVAALARSGWRVVHRTEHELHVHRGGEQLLVPRAGLLHPDVLMEVLRQAGVTPSQFVEALDSVDVPA